MQLDDAVSDALGSLGPRQLSRVGFQRRAWLGPAGAYQLQRGADASDLWLLPTTWPLKKGSAFQLGFVQGGVWTALFVDQLASSTRVRSATLTKKDRIADDWMYGLVTVTMARG